MWPLNISFSSFAFSLCLCLFFCLTCIRVWNTYFSRFSQTDTPSNIFFVVKIPITNTKKRSLQFEYAPKRKRIIDSTFVVFGISPKSLSAMKKSLAINQTIVFCVEIKMQIIQYHEMNGSNWIEIEMERKKSRSFGPKMHSGIWLTPFGIYVMNWFRILHLMKSPKNPPHTHIHTQTLTRTTLKVFFVAHRIRLLTSRLEKPTVKILLANFNLVNIFNVVFTQTFLSFCDSTNYSVRLFS